MIKERVRPSPESIERVRKLGEKQILRFLDEVSLGSVRNLVEYLPTVHGFRPQSEAGINQQKSALAKKLSSRTGGADRDHFALYVMWKAWAWERLGDADAAEHLLDELEKGLPTRSQNERPVEQDRANALRFIEGLKELSLENRCPRETIERLLEFSPLVIDDAIQKIVASCKSTKDIARDAAISNLPTRLQEDEKEIQAIQERVTSLASELTAAVDKLDSLTLSHEEREKSLHTVAEELAALRQAISSQTETANRYEQWHDRHKRKIEELEAQVKAGGLKHDELISLVEATISPVEAEVRQLKEALAPLLHKWEGVSPANNAAVNSLSKELAVLSAQVLSLADSTRLEEIAALGLRISILEDEPKVGAAFPTVGHVVEEGSLNAVLIPRNGAQKPTVWTEVTALVAGLSTNLQSVGLKKTAAVTLADEVCAAVLTGQVVFFKGGLASLVARKCAETISSGVAWTISIPIGLTDGSALTAAMRSRVATSAQYSTSFVLEGINRSALDATKESLFALESDHATTGQPPVFCFATLVSGVASLPVEPEYFELGPVLDLDYLDWRLLPEPGAAAVDGLIAIDVVSSLLPLLLQSAGDDLDEALRVVRLFVHKRNPRVERIVAKAFLALKNLRGLKSEISPMQSLAYGWLTPLWVARGVSKENADSELDGGKCDTQRADARISVMLLNEHFGLEPSEGGK